MSTASAMDIKATAPVLHQAIRVDDQLYLIENFSAAFLDAVCKSIVAIRSAVGAATVAPHTAELCLASPI